MANSAGTYFGAIGATCQTLAKGLQLTLRHILQVVHSRTPRSIQDTDYFQQTRGIQTIQYPYEMQPIPENGRYRLHNEIDDCIVCDKCAKVCPVDCITIEPIKSPTEFGRTSDDTPKRIYAATFNIDMGKCCFCGLCTTVCPTECLTMTPVFDYSVYHIEEHHFAFANLSEAEIEQRKREWQEHLAAKAVQPKTVTSTDGTDSAQANPQATPIPPAPRPVFKPKIKPPPAS